MKSIFKWRHTGASMAKTFSMASVRDSDTSLWLHNKLGSSDDLWSGSSICSQLTRDVLRNIYNCFLDLQSHVKLKLLLSFLHIPRRNVEEWKTELEDIIKLAIEDRDQWVSTLAEVLKTYPETGALNLGLEENAKIFNDMLSDMKKIVRRYSERGMFPMECLYLSRNAMISVIGSQPQPIKHFTLKRKPKSAALRAELLQKSSEVASQKKNALTPSVPIKSRNPGKKMDDSTPLKGIPSRPITGGFKSPPSTLNRPGATPPLSRPLPRTPAGRRDGGIKLLDIAEQPIGFGKDAKRRKKQQEIEEQQRKEKEAATATVPTTTTTVTPDYAAGLLTTGISTQQLTSPAATASASASLPSSGPTYVPPSSRLPTAMGGSVVLPLSSVTAHARENLQQQLHLQLTQSQVRTQTTTSAASTSTSTATTTTTPAAPATPGTTTAVAAQPPKRGLSLTKEQMLEAQEMFRSSNKVTRPEKALILGFMAGSRENPCAEFGDIITIKLNEDQERVTQTNGTVQNMVAETFFQMNYSNGRWQRIKKYRAIEA